MKSKKMFVLMMVVLLVAGLWPCELALGAEIVAWGQNWYGECDGPAGNDFTKIATGFRHSLGLRSDGSLAAWGHSHWGQCDVPEDATFVDIAGGGGFTLALKPDASLAAWGQNNSGQCDVPPGNDFADIACGSVHSLALKCDGSLVAWGNNGHGQCDVPAGNDFIAIAAGGNHSVALSSEGLLIAWGQNYQGQCEVPPGDDFVAITAGEFHNLAIRFDGSLVAWGYNNHGQCDMPPDNDYVAIAAGCYHSVALKYDGSLVAWGSNMDASGRYVGQCDVPAGNNFVAIAAGGFHNLVLKELGLPTDPPIADAGGPYSIYVGDSLILDASGSTDADDDIVSYMWDLDDDGTFETDAGGQAIFDVDYAYLDSLGLIAGGPYDIHVQVTDSERQSDTDSSALTILAPPVIKAVVDIKPRSCPNPLNVKSKGVVPVAILGSVALDVTTIDAGSIFLNGARNVRSSYEDVAGFIADANDCECTTLGPDGYLDLTLKFKTQDIVATLGEVNHDDVLELQLDGVLSDETPVEGADCVVIRGKHKPINKADINKDGVVNMADVVMVAENWLLSSIVED